MTIARISCSVVMASVGSIYIQRIACADIDAAIGDRGGIKVFDATSQRVGGELITAEQQFIKIGGIVRHKTIPTLIKRPEDAVAAAIGGY